MKKTLILNHHFAPWQAPYVCFNNNPIYYSDPNGLEGIVISGGEYDSDDRFKYNFIEPAITRLKELKEEGIDESITWVVMTAGYSELEIQRFQDIANDLGVGFQAINSADDLTNYLNSKNTGNTALSVARQEDLITSMTIFGHGTSREGESPAAQFGYGQSNASDYSWSTDHIKKINRNAFGSGAKTDLYTCNSATNTSTHKSFGYTLSAQTGSVVTGYRGQSTYRYMYVGQSLNDRIIRNIHGFNISGTQRMPQAGEGAIRVKFIPSSKQTLSPYPGEGLPPY
jgi:hypothetical protein